MHDLKPWVKEPDPRPSPTGTLAYIASGVLIWGGQFMTVYVLHTLMCRLGFSPETTRWVILGLTGLTILAIGLLLLRLEVFARLLGLVEGMEQRKSYDFIAHYGLLLALFAVAWTGIATALLSTCA